jgi:hypothetical protein
MSSSLLSIPDASVTHQPSGRHRIVPQPYFSRTRKESLLLRICNNEKKNQHPSLMHFPTVRVGNIRESHSLYTPSTFRRIPVTCTWAFVTREWVVSRPRGRRDERGHGRAVVLWRIICILIRFSTYPRRSSKDRNHVYWIWCSTRPHTWPRGTLDYGYEDGRRLISAYTHLRINRNCFCSLFKRAVYF